MKICAIICEYNPFHNGHLHQLQEAKRLSGADAVLCVMSGNFVQRGEAAVLDKHTRARHAILAGADIFVELPTAFATSNAELFAKGAIKILSSIPDVRTLCFGAENANKTAFVLAARQFNDEPKEVSEKIKTLATQGMSYAKARAQAWAGFVPLDILSSPNNILGLEYTRALLSLAPHIEILPVTRIGSGYGESELQENFSSATAIRNALAAGQDVGKNLPDLVKNDLPSSLQDGLESLEKYALLTRSLAEIASVCDCNEGLENAFKRAARSNVPLVESLTSARYTSSRIRRIALQNLLQISETDIRAYLTSSLYLRVLAAKKGRTDVLAALSGSAYPVIARAHDEDVLTGAGKKCYETDLFAEDIYRLLYPEREKGKTVFI